MRKLNPIRHAMRLLTAGSLGVAALWTPAAHASPEFPQVISEELATPCVPQCTLCHLTAQGGANTTDGDKPFFVSMLGAGLMLRNQDSVRTALMTLGDTADSDQDGVPDTTELSDGRDPNVSGEGQLCGGPTYGCGARLAPSRAPDLCGLGAAFAAALALFVAMRRRL